MALRQKEWILFDFSTGKIVFGQIRRLNNQALAKLALNNSLTEVTC